MESTEISRQDISRFMEDIDPYIAHGRDDISPFILKKSAATFDRPLEIFKNTLGER